MMLLSQILVALRRGRRRTRGGVGNTSSRAVAPSDAADVSANEKGNLQVLSPGS